jgi:putative addiction module killer protein
MIRVQRTEAFAKWLRKLNDRKAKAIIVNHIDLMEGGSLGRIEPVGAGVYEKKINYGPGYRLYLCKKGLAWIVLLCGGDKSTQPDDINRAKALKEALP